MTQEHTSIVLAFKRNESSKLKSLFTFSAEQIRRTESSLSSNVARSQLRFSTFVLVIRLSLILRIILIVITIAISSSSIALRKKRRSMTFIIHFTQFSLAIAKIRELRDFIDSSIVSDDFIKDKIIQQLLKTLIIVKNLAVHLKKVMKTIFIIAMQLNDIAVIKATIWNDLILQYNKIIETQHTIQINLDRVLDLKRAIYDEDQKIDDYLTRTKLNICLQKFVEFLMKLN